MKKTSTAGAQKIEKYLPPPTLLESGCYASNGMFTAGV